MAEEELQLAERRREVAAAAERVGRRGALRQCELLAEAGRALARNENPKTLLYFLGNEVASLAQGEKRAAKETTW